MGDAAQKLDALTDQRPAKPAVERGWYDTEAAAQYLGISPDALRKQVGRKNITPDHRGQRGNGLKSNQFSKATLDAFMRRGSSGEQ